MKSDPRRAASGRLLVLVAAVLWSTSGFFAKSPIFDDWDESARGGMLAFWRALFAALILLAFVRRPSFNWKMGPMLIAFLAMNVTFLTAMVMTTAANTIWLQHTAPVWIFLASAIVLGETVSRRDWQMLVFAVFGVGVILFFELRNESFAGVLLGLASGFFYACVVLSLRALRGIDSAWLVALNHVFTAMVLLPFVIWHGTTPSGFQLFLLACFGVFQMGLPYLLFARGLRSITSHEAAGIVLLEPILVPVWVWLAWHSTPSYDAPKWWTFVGAAFILLGLVLRYLGGGKAVEPAQAND